MPSVSEQECPDGSVRFTLGYLQAAGGQKRPPRLARSAASGLAGTLGACTT